MCRRPYAHANPTATHSNCYFYVYGVTCYHIYSGSFENPYTTSYPNENCYTSALSDTNCGGD